MPAKPWALRAVTQSQRSPLFWICLTTPERIQIIPLLPLLLPLDSNYPYGPTGARGPGGGSFSVPGTMNSCVPCCLGNSAFVS